MLKNRNQLVLVLILVIGVCFACNDGQTDDANKLISEANDMYEKSKKGSAEGNQLFLKLLGDNLTNAKDVQLYKNENKSEFDKLIKLSEDSLKMSTEVSEKFEKATKLDIDEKHKEYLILSKKSLQKEIEGEKLQLSTIKEFLETKDIEKMEKLIEDFNNDIEKINIEAVELEKKAQEFGKDNSDIIE